MTPTCAHPHCRTSLGDSPVMCPHWLTFCEHCTWEEACDECANDAHAARAAEVKAAFASMPVAPTPPTRELEPACRCGWPDEAPYGAPPVRVEVVDLTAVVGGLTVETSDSQRACRSCTHPIAARREHVVHRLPAGEGVFNRYHAACVETGDRAS